MSALSGGSAAMDPLAATGPMPWSISTVLAFSTFQFSVTLAPSGTTSGVAVKETIAGSAESGSKVAPMVLSESITMDKGLIVPEASPVQPVKT